MYTSLNLRVGDKVRPTEEHFNANELYRVRYSTKYELTNKLYTVREVNGDSFEVIEIAGTLRFSNSNKWWTKVNTIIIPDEYFDID